MIFLVKFSYKVVVHNTSYRGDKMKKPYSKIEMKIYNLSTEEKIASVCHGGSDDCNDNKNHGPGGHGGHGGHNGLGHNNNGHTNHIGCNIPNIHGIS